jgi:hypothetical protein
MLLVFFPVDRRSQHLALELARNLGAYPVHHLLGRPRDVAIKSPVKFICNLSVFFAMSLTLGSC